MQGKKINAVNMGNVWKLSITNSALKYILEGLTEAMYSAEILVELLLLLSCSYQISTQHYLRCSMM